jgi:hypothetical protein
LKQARTAFSRADDPEIGAAYIIVRDAEMRIIEHIIGLGPELNVPLFTKIKILMGHHVHVEVSRPYE